MEADPAIPSEATATPAGIRGLLARPGGPYAGADIALARRMGVVLWAFGIVVVAVLEVFFPPTNKFGALGWLVAGVGWSTTVLIVLLLANKRRPVGWNFLYFTGFVGVGLIALTQYCAGGRIAPYHELYMFHLIGAALVHPPRRVVGMLLVIAAAMFAPAVYAPDSALVGEIVTELFLWVALSIVLMALIQTIRVQRTGLRKEGADARQLARVDALTGLGNRRAFDEALDLELARSRRTTSPLSLIVADLNEFKEINDEFGHVQGDDCLRQAATTLREAVRRPDLCFRWGGDEFAILLTGADATVARALAIRLEAAVARECGRPDGDPLTVTCGEAVLDATMTAAEAMARSDAALLALKAHDREDPAAPATLS
jgi:diguanylate cyclase (GGDEF)-like protein